MIQSRIDPQEAASKVILHCRARWLGVVLMTTGLLLFVGALTLVILGQREWSVLLVSFASVGLGLATFGTHSDTALTLMREYRGKATLPENLARELDQEFIFNRLALSELKATPKTAWVMTLLALGAIVWAIIALLNQG